MKRMTHTSRSFLNLLKSHPLEDIDSIIQTEKILHKKRGYAAAMPKKGADVIHLVSGGIDSISSWAMLMETYKLRVHPVCIETHQKRHVQEIKAVRYFSKLFKKRYPKLYVDPFIMTFPTATPEISRQLRGNLSKTIHPQVISDNFDPQTNASAITRQYLFPAFFPYPAALAALFFQLQRNVKIRTIFCSILPTDGLFNASQTFTALRAAAFSLCAFTHDFSWQVISLCFEKDLGFLRQKSDLIRWAHAKSISIERAYTCLKGGELHCGECLTCSYRKESFAAAGVPDTTIYINEQGTPAKKIVDVIKRSPMRHIYAPFLHAYKHSRLHRKIFIKDFY